MEGLVLLDVDGGQVMEFAECDDRDMWGLLNIVNT
ncbi:hypothetical protein SAMN05444320_103494 [Streptoalloteichus hindustanus]|uniref:Uncharacterized protein n=1 Tax=Streptoalloteichus hindustanus TaxID=2017 RepID=A0A1M5BBF4_STRHI|nr:hypothetical protein SAMN05444320_103494 [Streptoalloteichus hindustanus]